ncbi:MAG: DNA mismatch repair endonuclease MutL, partial [Candidatus Margulisbacteria bacterium]|nr:DNA mismatch repair endonuclease MutL [Candidatus Margulisiibacteriota bacterium]
AGATRVTVQVSDAGKKLILVSDNGSGMTKAELELAVQRHATSKITSLDDLFSIRTLGFRGEALPSIAAVSRFEAVSSGARVVVEGGSLAKSEDYGGPQGTSIEVRDLFYNTPARLKFLKTNYTEQGHIIDAVTKTALSRPSVAFRLSLDGADTLMTSGGGDLLDAVVSLYGVELAESLLPVQFEKDGIKVCGLVSKPNISRVDRNYESFFVNGRFVRYFLLNRALEDAYRTLIPGNRYPVGILFIEIDPGEVDVNVHPAKREIKFKKAREVMSVLTSGVASGLSKLLGDQDIGPSTLRQDSGQAGSGQGYQEMREWKPEMMEIFSETGPRTSDLGLRTLEVTDVQPLMPLYQHKNTYIICTDGEDIIFIDQHAAHERIIFDELQTVPAQGIAPQQQSLLVPENLEFTAKESAVIEENLEEIKQLGFDIEAFGKNSFVVRSVPNMLTKVPAKEMLLELLSELSSVEKRKENIFKMIACKAAIKAGDRLSTEEMNQLIKDLYKTENPLTCPHGRPTMVKLSQADFERMFART